MIIKRLIIITLLCFSMFSESLGQLFSNNLKKLTLETSVSIIYVQSKDFLPKLSIFLLYKNNLNLNTPPKSGLLYGFGCYGIYNNRIKERVFVSAALEYFNGFLEIDAKLHLSVTSGAHYYFEPQIGVYFKKQSSVLLLGYNLSLDPKNLYHDIVGPTLSFNYRLRKIN